MSDALAARPRERGGAVESNRSSFQKNWALCHLCELHRTSTDYAIVFDYHDDIVVIDRGAMLGELHFYQIKTKIPGDWSIHQLTVRDGGTGGSILGKLYRHKLDFGQRVGSLSLISNARFNLKLADNTTSESRERVSIHELHPDEKNLVDSRIAEEHSLRSAPQFPNRTDCCVCELSVAGQNEGAIGTLARFFEDFMGGCDGVNVVAAHRTLFDEIRRRTEREGTWVSVDEIVERKGLTRGEFERLLSRISSSRDVRSAWASISIDLANAGMSLTERQEVERQWRRYWAQRMDESNRALQGLRDQVVSAIIEERRLGNIDILAMLNSVVARVGSDRVFSASYVRAIALMEMAANEHPALQEVGSQSQDKTP